MTSRGKPTSPNSRPEDATPCEGSVAPCPREPVIRRENVVFVGSEMSYDSFWLKMMFISAAYVGVRAGARFRSADKKTIAYVDVGYTRAEKLTLDYLRSELSFNIVRLSDSADVVKYINERPESVEDDRSVRHLLQDVAFFSHGLPGVIKLNYSSSPAVDFSASELASVRPGVFVPDGRVYSYACRTGVSRYSESFSSDQEAGMEDSLAQKMANHFKVEVHAFLRRSFYGNVLREKKDSSVIATALKEARKTQEGKVIQISAEHEALPHPGLASGWFSGARREGTSEYALWRKAGGIRLPGPADTPEGLSAGMHVFLPEQMVP
jgi:hypothetical protein